jgi:L-histidine N-alpha-methyltransferase
MAGEIRASLGRRPRSIPCKYFYDDRGSALFEEITRLPEYYQTRTEEKILEGIASTVIDRMAPRELMELGSGVGRKIRLLLDAAIRQRPDVRCLLFDINESYLRESVRRLQAEYMGAEVQGLLGDFTRDLPGVGAVPGRLAVFFAGTIGNLHPTEVRPFLRSVASTLEPGGGCLLGVDLVKDVTRLEAAYNDSAGVTAAFNRNVLQVLNDQLGADFDPNAFRHVAFYDVEHAWIEMRLRAEHACEVHIPGARLSLSLARGEEIHTELSCKYTRASLTDRLEGTGLRIVDWFTDPEELFALALLERTAQA